MFTGASSLTNQIVKANTFYSDCTSLGTLSIGLIPQITIYNAFSNLVLLMSNTDIRIGTSYTGVSISPFTGYSIVASSLNILTGIISGIIFLLLAVMVMLGVIYFLFPIFLYLGIVLRSIPWTRAAGGAFLALFLGFYILFPFLLHIMLVYSPVVSVTVPNFKTAVCITASSCFVDFSSVYNTVTNIVESFAINGYAATFITTIIAPSAYALVAVIVSLYVALEFVNIMADFLGAPSLTSHHTLRRLL